MFNQILLFVDKLLYRSQPADALHISILDPKTDLEHLYYKASLFYHSTLYDKLFEILDCAYEGTYRSTFTHL